MVEQEKLNGCGEEQADKYSCIPACLSTVLRYYGCNDYPQGLLKQEITNRFSWPNGSTFGNYKRIVEDGKLASSFEMTWPLVDDKYAKDGKNRAILEKANKLLHKGALILISVVAGEDAHCQVIYRVSHTHVYYWEPGNNSLTESQINEYLEKMLEDAMSIGPKL